MVKTVCLNWETETQSLFFTSHCFGDIFLVRNLKMLLWLHIIYMEGVTNNRKLDNLQVLFAQEMHMYRNEYFDDQNKHH